MLGVIYLSYIMYLNSYVNSLSNLITLSIVKKLWKTYYFLIKVHLQTDDNFCTPVKMILYMHVMHVIIVLHVLWLSYKYISFNLLSKINAMVRCTGLFSQLYKILHT